MDIQLSCIVVDADPANCQEVAAFLTSYGVQVLGQLLTAEQLPAALNRSDPPRLVVINLDPSPHETLRKVGALLRQHPNVSFFAMSQVMDPSLLMEAMHQGIREFIPMPVDEQKFVAGLERIAQLHGLGRRARIINVIPSAGGCGSTTVACNVGVTLAQAGKAVLLDLDLIRGTVATSFDLRPRYTIADVADSAERLDGHLLDNALAVHEGSGLAILARPDIPEDSQRVSQASLQRLLNILTRVFDYVVMDSVMGVDALSRAGIAAADLNVVVMQLTVPSARNAERFVGALRRMGVADGKIRLVVNRFVKKGWDIAPEEVEKTLGLKISWLIPNDFRNALGAINFGEPVVLRAPRAGMSDSLRGLAGMLNGKSAH